MLYTLSFGHLKVAGGAKVLVLNFLGKRMVVLVQKGSSIQNVFYKQNGRPEHQKTNLLKQQDNLTIKLGDFTVRVKSKPAFYFPNRMAVKEENNKMFYCATQRGFPDQPPSEWSLKDVPPPQLVIPTGRPVKLEVTAPGRKLPEVLQVEWMSHCASFLTLGPEEARSELEVGAKASHRPRSREFKTPRGEKPIDGHGKRGSKTLRDVWCAEQPQQALLQEETQIAKVMARMQKRSNSSKTAKRKSKPGAPPASLPEENRPKKKKNVSVRPGKETGDSHASATTFNILPYPEILTLQSLEETLAKAHRRAKTPTPSALVGFPSVPKLVP